MTQKRKECMVRAGGVRQALLSRIIVPAVSPRLMLIAQAAVSGTSSLQVPRSGKEGGSLLVNQESTQR